MTKAKIATRQKASRYDKLFVHLPAILITAKPESELTTSPGIVETPPVYKRIRFLPFQKPTPVSLKYITNKLLFTKRLL
jgi:hypothetical protein